MSKYTQKKTPSKIHKILKYSLVSIFSFLSVVLVCGFGVGVGIVTAYVKEQEVLSKQEFQKKLDGLIQTSYAYFQDKNKKGKPIPIGALRFDSNREVIHNIDEVSPYLVKAFISIEDHSFYDHNGIVLRSIARAGFQHLFNTDVTTGASTITQQLIKNVILKNREQDWERKSKEIVLALRMEQYYSKDEILMYYMNSVYFGRGAHGSKMYGVYAAAKGIFDIHPKDLSIAQAAYIAGMVQRPNDYNPISDPTNLQSGLDRMKLVLSQMLKYGNITEKEYNHALKFNIKSSLAKPSDFKYAYKKYPFIMFALEEEAAKTLMKMDNLNIQKLKKEGTYYTTLKEYRKRAVTGGYHFHTTIDKDLYKAINQAATKGINFHTKSVNGQKTKEQLGATLIDNQTGAVLAFVSSSQKFSLNQKDHAFDVPRQPGSSIKPLLVYGPALEERLISPHSKIVDEKIPKSDGSGYYKNAGRTYHGPVTVSQALKWSYNIPAIKIFNALGHNVGFQYLKQMNLPPHKKDGEAAAIGGMTHGYTVTKMAAAFATFGNQGKYNEPYVIEKVTDAKGNVLWKKKTTPKPVFSPQTSYQVTKILRKVVEGGTASKIGNQLPNGIKVAGKTGTTNSDRDVWFIGYTPKITLAVWSGYDYHFTIPNHGIAQEAWLNIFQAAAKTNGEYFPKGAEFHNPGDLPPEICGFECTEVRQYYEEKRKEAEERRRKQQEKEKKEEKKEEKPKEPEEPEDPEGPDKPKEPEEPPTPGDPTDPNDPQNPDTEQFFPFLNSSFILRP